MVGFNGITEHHQYIKFLMSRTSSMDRDHLDLDIRDYMSGRLPSREVSRLIDALKALPIRFPNRIYEDYGPHKAPEFPTEERKQTMLEKILKMYVMAMAGDVRSPLPHIVGPAGCGKSTAVEQAAQILGVNLHVINVSRISPLELEGAQMPNHDSSKLVQLTATWWSQLKDGDILLLDEFLRGFPEVYNGLLDILTSRKVGNFTLPKVFIMAASNSVTTYDQALEDRLLHLPVDDPRTSKTARAAITDDLIEHIGLYPAVAKSIEMAVLVENEVLPMFELLDQFKGAGNKVGSSRISGSSPMASVRKLIGQARLRMVESANLLAVIEHSNQLAIGDGKWQYVILMRDIPPANYVNEALKLRSNPKLTKLQATNLAMNDQILGMAKAQIETEQDEKEMDDELFA